MSASRKRTVKQVWAYLQPEDVAKLEKVARIRQQPVPALVKDWILAALAFPHPELLHLDRDMTDKYRDTVLSTRAEVAVTPAALTPEVEQAYREQGYDPKDVKLNIERLMENPGLPCDGGHHEYVISAEVVGPTTSLDQAGKQIIGVDKRFLRKCRFCGKEQPR